MSKDLYKNRKMYQNPVVLIITIICVAILSIFIIDIVSKNISIKKIDNDTKIILEKLMKYDGIDKDTYIKEEFQKRGYEKSDYDILNINEYTVLINNSSYFTIVGELFHKPKYYTSSFKGKMNEYSEIVIEKYDEEKEEIKNEEDVIIK